MDTIIDLCFLCSKDYNCTPVDEKIVSQVKYLLPEITIFKLGLRFCICSICDGALYSFSKFKQYSVQNIRRLEARIKGAQSSPIPFNNHFDLNDYKTSDTQLGTTEETFVNDEYSIALLETNSVVSHNQLHKDRVSQNIQLRAHTNADSSEELLTKEEHMGEIPTGIELYNNILKEEYFNSDSQLERNTEYRCNICTKIFGYKALLSRHIKKNHLRIKILTCKLCKMSFIRNYDLKKHLELHNGIKNFPCFICKKRFVNNRCLKQHIILHSKQKDNKDESNKTVDCFECTVCNKKFKSKYYVINEHMKTHLVKKLYECEFCDESFKRKTKLAVHRRSHVKKEEYGIEKIFSCSFCKKVFKKQYLLNYHVKIHYERVRKFECNVCKKGFLHGHHLKTHLKIHLGKKDYKCKICKKAFLRKDHLTTHLKVHSDVREFRCDICGKTFKRMGYMAQHVKRHGEAKLYECSICKKEFSQKHYLVFHLESHSQPISQELYKCQICKKVFYGKNRLNGHMASHGRKNVKKRS